MGSGRTGTVWLAVHLGLEEYRAIKCVSKENADYETFRREALVLKELRHPGIPMIYDLEEDSEYFYLIEEYLGGYSLYALIMRQGPLKDADAAQYGMQICGLVEYMHSACEIPILHLDLQPNNLMICDGAVKLIDFDHAADSRDANMSCKRYGTVGCAAPEQYTSDRMLDQRTDIYAIGAVLRFMTTGTLREEGRQSGTGSEAFERIISKCMEPNMERRYASAGEAEDALRALCTISLTDDKEHKTIPSHSLIITGMRPGAGATHLAFGLARFLTGQGYQVLYEEHNPSQAVSAMAQRAGARGDRFGIYAVNRCFLKPWYGPAVRLDEPDGFQIIVKDYGTDWRQAERELKQDRVTLLAAGSAGAWEERYIRQFVSWLARAALSGETGLDRESSLGRETGLGRESNLGRESSLGRETGLGRKTGLGRESNLGRETGLGRKTGLGRESSLGRETGLGREPGLGREIRWGREIRPNGRASRNRRAGPAEKTMRTVLVFRGMDSQRRKALRASGCLGRNLKGTQIFKGMQIFGSPEYGDPFAQRQEVQEFFGAVWSAVSGCSMPRKGKRGWLKRWDKIKKVFLNAAGLMHRDAESSESQERDGGRG